MSKAEVYAPTSEGMIRIGGTSQSNRVHHIVFQGITFANDHWSLLNVAGSVGATTVQANAMYNKYVSDGNWHSVTYRNTSLMPATVEVTGASDIQFVRNVFEHLGAGAITFGNDTVNSSIVGNRFSDISGSAITVGDPLNTYIGDGDFAANQEGAPTNITVQNNYVINASVEFLQTVPVTIIYTVNLNLANNLIVNSPYTAISLGWGWNYFAGYEAGVTPTNVASGNTIQNNRILSSMKLLHDGAAIYTVGKQTGTRITGNYMSDIGGASYGNGIYTDQASSEMEIDHNVVENFNGVWWFVWGTYAYVSQLNVHDNYTDYATGNEGSFATSTTRTNNVTEPSSPPVSSWSSGAQAIINGAGLQPAYRDIASSGGTVFEAEGGVKFGGAAVYDDTAAANGQGVQNLALNGDALQFNNVPAGTQLTLKYATPNTGSFSLYVNGVKTSVSIASTGGWNTYGVKVVPINIPEGASIKFQHDTGDIGVNLDQIVASYGHTVLEAEWGSLSGRASAYGDPAASGGQGVQYLDVNGDALQFNNVPAGTQLALRYATQNTGNFSLYVNGVRTSVSIASTGSWYGNYGVKVIPIHIPQGASIKFQHGTGDIGINLDQIVVSNGNTVLEAESGSLSGRASVYSDSAASGGQGVQNLDLNGDALQFNNVPAGTQLTLRYASPNTGKYSIYVNGVKTSVAIPPTGSWFGYGTVTIPIGIPAGATLRLQHDTGDIGINLDQIIVSNGNTALEAESGSLSGRAAVYSDPAASGGQGVQNLDMNGDALQFHNMPAGTQVTLKYATPSTGNYSLYVNGVKVSAAIPSTGSWFGYGTVTIPIGIPAGATLRLQHDTGDIGINLDQIIVSNGITVLEAERGSLSGRAAVYSDSTASGGQGVQNLDLNGDALQFHNVPAGTQLTLRFATPNPGNYSLYVNGVKTSAAIPSTGSWFGYGTVTIPMGIPAGATLRLQHDTGDIGINLDVAYLQ